MSAPPILWPDRPFRAFAKADIVCNPFDVINWEYSFTPPLEDCYHNWTMSFDGESPYPSYNEDTASGGSWRITATTGAFNEAGNAVAVWVAEVVVGTLTAVNQSVEFSVGYGENPLMTFSQPNALFSAEIMVEQIRRYEDNGSIPVVNAYNDQLILYYDSTPNSGIFRAKAQVYNNQGQLISSSNEITLTVVSVLNAVAG